MAGTRRYNKSHPKALSVFFSPFGSIHGNFYTTPRNYRPALAPLHDYDTTAVPDPSFLITAEPGTFENFEIFRDIGVSKIYRPRYHLRATYGERTLFDQVRRPLKIPLV